jgi:hypothetical protein
MYTPTDSLELHARAKESETTLTAKPIDGTRIRIDKDRLKNIEGGRILRTWSSLRAPPQLLTVLKCGEYRVHPISFVPAVSY